MKVDVKTPDGDNMTALAATLPVGSALRIAPQFVATATNDDTGIETAVEAKYYSEAGRYVMTAVVNRATREDFDEPAMRRVVTQAILQAAIPQCIALQMSDDADAPWITVADLTANEGRIIPEWMAEAVVKRGMKAERMDVIEILYGTAALAGFPPVKAVQVELGVPHRTAADWIYKARAAGRLEGMSYTPGRQADG
ncbi:hypothetical protein M4I32_13340 [Microbacterium sp. LRZ72]|uniref:hypothetical protein n=1 Tax=Microbacterium sp. LRZ72 TaxID=2942481 RepID=UPI0029B9D4B2|nr:hypothetical protein [Microbacterium sp. LRZ72]MDX2377785.1 hypothetical protein [Microbacterium sp. LRZ72]